MMCDTLARINVILTHGWAHTNCEGEKLSAHPVASRFWTVGVDALCYRCSGLSALSITPCRLADSSTVPSDARAA